MSVDGVILSDLRRVLSEEKTSPFFFLVSGPAGSGKTTTLNAVISGAGAYGMRVIHGVPPLAAEEDKKSSEVTEWGDANVRIFSLGYNTLRTADTSRVVSTAEDAYPEGTVVLLDDIEAVDYLLRLHASSHHLESTVRRLLRSPRCALVTSAVDLRHVPRWLLTIWTPLTYKLQELTSSSARRLVRFLPNADKWSACVSGEKGDALVSCLRTRRALMLSLCHASFMSTESHSDISPAALHFLGQAKTVSQSTVYSSSYSGTLFGLDTVVERVETLVRLFMERDNYVGHRLLASVASTTGILLHGPSGSGKTALATRLSTYYPGRYFVVSCPTLFSKYLGESEERLRDAFLKARQCAPSVLVLDNVDVIGASRGSFSDADSGEGLNVMKRMLAALLCELDGLLDSKDVLVIGTTNAPGTLDRALLRQGRFETLVYVPPLTFEAAREMTLEFLDGFDDATAKEREDLGFLVASRAEGCAAASLKAFLREVFEQHQQQQWEGKVEESKQKMGAAKVNASEETKIFLPTEELVRSALLRTTVLEPVKYEFSSL